MAQQQQTPSHRPPWTALPVALQDEVAQRLGSPVVSNSPKTGGFTAGVASVIELADGANYFVKALPLSDDQAQSYRHEVAINAVLPSTVPAPKLQFHTESNEWLLLCFDNIRNGRSPGNPWTAADLDLTAATLRDLIRLLTPSPSMNIRRIEDAYAEDFSVWRRLAQEGTAGKLSPSQLGDLSRYVDEFAAVEENMAPALSGTALTHMDIRWDNLVIDDTPSMSVVDWAHPALAAPWVDAVGFICSVEDPKFDREAFLQSVVLDHGDYRADIDTFLVALAGMWLERCRDPELPGRQLRRQQERSAAVTIEWLRHRGMDIPQLPTLGLS